MTSYSIAIPARLASTRLPGKMLALLGGKPVVQWVIERALKVRNCQAVYVLTDSESVVQLAQSLGAIGLMTDPNCRCGTERIASALDHIKSDWVINVQGDEPFADTQFLEQMIDHIPSIDADLLTPIYRLSALEDVQNPNIVKVVCDTKQCALYFSRSPIPYVRDVDSSQWLTHNTFWGHCGVYAYRRDVLQAYMHLAPHPLEQAESLEQLRFVANGYRIATLETKGRSIAIDTAADLALAEQWIQTHPTA